MALPNVLLHQEAPQITQLTGCCESSVIEKASWALQTKDTECQKPLGRECVQVFSEQQGSHSVLNSVCG